VRQVVHFGERSSLLNWEVSGSLYCTNHRVCFVPDVNRVRGWVWWEVVRRRR